MGTGELELTTETVSVGDPRAVDVDLVGLAPGVSLLTRGTLLISPGPGPFQLGLKVAGTFTTVTTARGDPQAVARALRRAAPPGCGVEICIDGATLMVTFVDITEATAPVVLEAVCTDMRLGVRAVSDNTLVLSGVVRGRSQLTISIGALELGLSLLNRETPLQVATRLRTLLGERFNVLLTVPALREGDVTVTVLPRR